MYYLRLAPENFEIGRHFILIVRKPNLCVQFYCTFRILCFFSPSCFVFENTTYKLNWNRAKLIYFKHVNVANNVCKMFLQRINKIIQK